MTPKEREVMQQALEALENAYENGFLTGITGLKTIDIITALRAAFALQEALADQKPVFSSKCPKCGHKVISTHTADVWWCKKCQHEWPFQRKEEQEPVATILVDALIDAYVVGFCDLPQGVHKLYAAPVRTKDLTDDEIDAIEIITDRQFARAVIAADREKNK